MKRDLDTEIEELLSGEDGRSGNADMVESVSGVGEWRCRWRDCQVSFVEQERLVHHLHTGQ